MIHQKPKKTLEEITRELCSVLSIQQANTRRMLQQKKYQHVKQATVTLQAGARGMAARRLYKEAKQTKAATVLQDAAWRALIGQLIYAHMLIALLNQNHRIQNLSLLESDGNQKSMVGWAQRYIA